MSRVICTLPNTDADLDGLEWTRQEDGSLLSPELTEPAVARYLSIPGFAAHAEPEPEPAKQAEAPAATATQPEAPAALPLRGSRAKAAAAEPPPAAEPAPATEQPKE